MQRQKDCEKRILMLKTVRKRIRIVTMNLVKDCDVEDCEPQCEEEKRIVTTNCANVQRL